MVEMGQHVGRKVTAIISGMDQPLGMYIGNSLEVMEAMEVLKGNVKGDLLEVSLLLGAHMLLLAGRVQTEAEGKALLQQQIDNGAGIAKFRELLIQQGGNPAIIEQPDLLPLSPCSLEVKAEKSGYLTHMDTAKIGRASQETGAGRAFKEQPLDFGAGIITKKRLGDYVEAGEVLAVIYSATDKACASAAEFFQSALTISAEKAPLPPLVLNIISA